MNWKTATLIGLVLVSLTYMGETTEAQDTGYYPYVFARGNDRQRIRSMPIELRPNRPFHFYGNSVRRRYYGRPAIPQAPVRRIFQPALPQLGAPRLGQRIRISPFMRR